VAFSGENRAGFFFCGSRGGNRRGRTISHMKAIVVSSQTGPAGLELRDVPVPTPAAHEILVQVEAVGINFADVLGALGRYPAGPTAPYIMGREFAGVAEDGRRVMGYMQQAACAEYVAVPEGYYWPQPEGWSSAQCAAFPVNYFTAWLLYWKAGLLRESAEPAPARQKLRPRVLVHAAAGGVGTACVQLGHILAFEVFGTASSPEKLARLAPLGLTHGIDYKVEDYEERVGKLTGGEGVDAAFDCLAGEHTYRTMGCLAEFGRIILFGNATGERPRFNSAAMHEKGLSAHGLWLAKLSANHQLIRQALDSMLPFILSGRLHPVIGTKFPLSAAGDALRLLLERQNFGKVVLTL
jgi:NADPH:quinone reductase